MKEPRLPKQKLFCALGMRAARLRDLAYAHERSAFITEQSSPGHDPEARRGWIHAHRTMARLAKREAARLEQHAKGNRPTRP